MFTSRPFAFLDRQHLFAAGSIVALAIALPWLGVHVFAPATNLWIARGLALLASFSVIAWIGLRMWLGEYSPQTDLPFDVCNLLALLLPLLIWRPTQALIEPLLYVILAGTLQAVITPNLDDGFPHFTFLKYWISHGGLIVVIVFTTVVFALPPTLSGIWRTAGYTAIYAFVLFWIDVWLDANYMFLRDKPPHKTLLDLFGPWPRYIPPTVLLMFFLFWLIYLAFAWVGRG